MNKVIIQSISKGFDRELKPKTTSEHALKLKLFGSILSLFGEERRMEGWKYGSMVWEAFLMQLSKFSF